MYILYYYSFIDIQHNIFEGKTTNMYNVVKQITKMNTTTVSYSCPYSGPQRNQGQNCNTKYLINKSLY